MRESAKKFPNRSGKPATMQQSRSQWKIPVVGAVALLVVLYLVFGRSGHKEVRYCLMFDAGSTGSRIHVFSFDAGSGKLLGEVFEEVKPGLSSYATPELAAQSLKPLMEIADKTVPLADQPKTPLALKATAGLRQLGQDKADATLLAVRKYMGTYKYPIQSVEIMDGSDEGVYAWITVNYLLGRLGAAEKKGTVSVMDLGGGSTQIVFEPKGSAMLKAPKEYVYKLKFGPHSYELYQNSYDRYGLMRARERILEKSESAVSPCVPAGAELTTNLNGEAKTIKPHSESSFESCVKHAKSILNPLAPCTFDKDCSFNGIFQPDISNPNTFSESMYAFSYFYDRTQLDGQKPIVTVQEFRAMGETACSSKSPDDLHKWQCLDLSYMYALLREGYHLSDASNLNIAKKIDGIETAWSLGAAVMLLANQAAS